MLDDLPTEQLSPDFCLSEFCDSVRAREDPSLWAQQCEPPDEVVENLRLLCRKTLQPLREFMGWPLRVTSGYRCRDLNSEIVGASPNSQHCEGLAADLRVAAWNGDEWSPEVLDPLTRDSVWAACDPTAWSPQAWLFAVAVVHIDALHIHQVISERDTDEEPRWVHVGYGTGREALRSRVVGEYLPVDAQTLRVLRAGE